MSSEEPDAFAEPVELTVQELARIAALDAMSGLLQQDARSWAVQLRTVGSLVELAAQAEDDGALEFLPLELAGSWRISQLTATRWVTEADWFLTALPLTLSLLESGALLRHQALVLLHRTRHCSPEVARTVEAELLPAGATWCPADLGRAVDRSVLRIESEQAEAAAAEQRRARAVASRRTFSRSEPDGMGLAGALLTAEQLVAWSAGLDCLERRERIADRACGIERTADQRRADLFAALPAMVLAGTAQDLTAQDLAGQDGTTPYGAAGAGGGGGNSPHRPWTLGPEQLAAQVVLHVHVPVSTVLDLSRAPGHLHRYGPVSAEHVRLLRPTSYHRVLQDGLTGRPIAVNDRPVPVDPDPQTAREQVQAMLRPQVVTDRDEPHHDPSARLARLIDLRDVRCAGPGCSATRCDRDHHEPYPHGPTSADNLGLLSRRCHRAKHAGWTLQRHPDGSTTWLSPLHRNYDRPSPHDPPPQVDPHQPPPPLRTAPDVPAPTYLTREPNPADPTNPQQVPRPALTDEPPF